MNDLIRVAELLSDGGEGDTSFWSYFEDNIISNSRSLTEEELIASLEALQRRKRRSISVWTAMESEVVQRIPNMDVEQIIRLLHIFTKFKKEHLLWNAFSDRILTFKGDLNIDEVLMILKLFHEGKRKLSKIWSFLMEKYLLGKGYML